MSKIKKVHQIDCGLPIYMYYRLTKFIALTPTNQIVR